MVKKNLSGCERVQPEGKLAGVLLAIEGAMRKVKRR